jgi:hypothetical protein
MGRNTGLAHKISFALSFIDPAAQSHRYLVHNSKMVLDARRCDHYWCIVFGRKVLICVGVALNIAI